MIAVYRTEIAEWLGGDTFAASVYELLRMQIECAGSPVRFSYSDIMKHFPFASKSTVRRAVQRLITEGLVKKENVQTEENGCESPLYSLV